MRHASCANTKLGCAASTADTASRGNDNREYYVKLFKYFDDDDTIARPGDAVMPRFMIVIAVAALLGSLARAEAGIVVTVDKSAQRLSVAVDGFSRYEWPVSTARWGYRTPNGTYRPQWLARKWFSHKYDWSPMPYSIFFDGGYAIHGSYEISHLGRPASHGCIRLHPENAALLFALVQAHMRDTRIVVTGERPEAQSRGRQSVEHIAKRHKMHRVRRGFDEIFNVPPDDDDAGYARRRWRVWR
jgi:L,D-transpeptidase catalytic domain